MVKIRLRRIGTRNVPAYRIVVADIRSPRDGRFIENLGTYDPRKAGDNFRVDLDRAKYWVQKGAQPSDTVRSILKKAERAAKAA
jgi:small subunit ribosomal protein S16